MSEIAESERAGEGTVVNGLPANSSSPPKLILLRDRVYPSRQARTLVLSHLHFAMYACTWLWDKTYLISVTPQENIGGCHVAMDDVERVQVPESLCQLNLFHETYTPATHT